MRAASTALAAAAVTAWAPCPAAAQAQDYPCAAPAESTAPAAQPWVAPLRQLATGAGVRVAVIDTGVAPSPELDQVLPGADLVSPQAPDPLFDCDLHGTVVAGVIAGNSAGIAPAAEIISVRQTSAHYRDAGGNDGGAGSVATLAEAINNALDIGARVINISVVSCLDPASAARLDASPLDAALARAEAGGAIVVAAAGNVTSECAQGSTVIPAHSPTVLAVGAREDAHQLAEYSVAAPQGALALSAPGRVEASPAPGAGWAAGTLGGRGEVIPFEGTSFAAPVLSGSIALLLERQPSLSPAQVREIVAAAAEPAGGAIEPYAVATQLLPGPPAQRERIAITPTAEATSSAAARWQLLAWVLSGLGAFLLAARALLRGRR
ncbi:S8 family serine peptidase [Corynebacterium liangguodongii]|uniref:Peptidase S8/S53 domain-containing protein n=1 Tax=Corynebacterium liangguodongii TaxID=2079535 RepID=A0A2S0WCB4_9CORY|nr:S8 family serine peptidase [Corynebacterium liangguodongii]AWB83405.1 hypothetical protein C3E79_01960 [Corynebacterium liangguodongii]PWC00505.1 hypothetical protein DF219_00990 [Corynebacterium liangguodongii]